jgi:hypothetical protein
MILQTVDRSNTAGSAHEHSTTYVISAPPARQNLANSAKKLTAYIKKDVGRHIGKELSANWICRIPFQIVRLAGEQLRDLAAALC